MLNRTISERYDDSPRCKLGRLEGSGEFTDPWIAEFKRKLLEHIAVLGGVADQASVESDSFGSLTETLPISRGADMNQSFREIVLLSGTLAKPGAAANCIVRATKVTIVSLQDSEYVDADVALAPPHLPDGQYELQFEGHRILVTNNAGRWSS